MQKLANDQNYKVPENFPEEKEIDVIVTLRVSDDGFIFIGPMECSGSIHKGCDVNQLKQFFIDDYKKQGYTHVELKSVEIDLPLGFDGDKSFAFADTVVGS